jgi:hypothetical protein
MILICLQHFFRLKTWLENRKQFCGFKDILGSNRRGEKYSKDFLFAKRKPIKSAEVFSVISKLHQMLKAATKINYSKVPPSKWAKKSFFYAASERKRQQNDASKMEFVLFIIIGRSSHHDGKCPFASSSTFIIFFFFSLIPAPLFSLLMLVYIFFHSIHLCNVHFVAIHHKTGIIKCLNILNVEWVVCVVGSKFAQLFDCSIFRFYVHQLDSCTDERREIFCGRWQMCGFMYERNGEGKNYVLKLLLWMMNMKKKENQKQFNYEAQQLITGNYRKYFKQDFLFKLSEECEASACVTWVN